MQLKHGLEHDGARGLDIPLWGEASGCAQEDRGIPAEMGRALKTAGGHGSGSTNLLPHLKKFVFKNDKCMHKQTTSP